MAYYSLFRTTAPRVNTAANYWRCWQHRRLSFPHGHVLPAWPRNWYRSV